jgi:hypothetical protein
MRDTIVTAASVIGPRTTRSSSQLSAGLTDSADAESCVRGTKVRTFSAIRRTSLWI